MGWDLACDVVSGSAKKRRQRLSSSIITLRTGANVAPEARPASKGGRYPPSGALPRALNELSTLQGRQRHLLRATLPVERLPPNWPPQRANQNYLFRRTRNRSTDGKQISERLYLDDLSEQRLAWTLNGGSLRSTPPPAASLKQPSTATNGWRARLPSGTTFSFRQGGPLLEGGQRAGRWMPGVLTPPSSPRGTGTLIQTYVADDAYFALNGARCRVTLWWQHGIRLSRI